MREPELTALIGAERRILLAAQAPGRTRGRPQAHLEAQQTGRPLGEVLQSSEELAEYWLQLSDRQRAPVLDPTQYTGIAAQKARKICDLWEGRLRLA